MSGSSALSFLTEPVPPRGEAVAVCPGIRRLVAPNPGPMTYHGTNTYLIDTAEGLVVIDPGPDDAAHVAAILRASGGRVETILLSHTHADHVGAVTALAAASGAKVGAWHAPAQPGFRPDIALVDGQTIAGCLALHTPGHASDHVCFASTCGTAGSILFSADHVMSWSSSIVSPPEGDMAAYFRSLQRLLERHDTLYLPGHGPPLPSPLILVRALLDHRVAREAAVLAALEPGVGMTVPAITNIVYAAAPAAIRPMAERNVLAHLLKLASDGAAVAAGEGWCRP